MKRVFKTLEKCIDLIARNEAKAEECLNNYPSLADYAAVLNTAAFLSQSIELAVPSPEVFERSKKKFLGAAKAEPALQVTKKRAQAKVHFLHAPLRKILTRAAATLVAFSMLGGSVVVASAHSLPDSPLYSVKLTVEKVQLVLKTSNYSKAQFYLNLAEKRLEEAQKLAKDGDSKGLKDCLKAMTDNLDEARKAANLLNPKEKREILTQIIKFCERKEKTFEVLALKASPEIKNIIGKALGICNEARVAVKVTTSKSEKPLTETDSLTETPQTVEETTKTPEGLSEITVNFPVFSPNGDKVKDNISITVRADVGQNLMADIFDLKGNLIKFNLVLKESSTKQGRYTTTWGGENNQGEIVSDGFYLIKVKVAKSSLYGSLETKVEVDLTPPEKPILISPAEGWVSKLVMARFTWDSSTDACLFVLEYSRDEDFSSDKTTVVSDLNMKEYFIMSDPYLSEGVWFWRVKAIDKVGNTSAYSEVRSFSVAIES